jgi:hypothetical protein
MKASLTAIATAVVLTIAVAPAAMAKALPADPALFCMINVAADAEPVCASSADGLAQLQARLGPAPAASVRIARLYDYRDYNTAAGFMDVYAPADCTSTVGDIDYQIADLGVWKDRVSSFQSVGNCATKLYSGMNYGGTSYPASGYLVASTYVGDAFNDRARSARFS